MLATLSSSRDDDRARGLLEGILAAGVTLVGGDTTGAKPGSTTLSLTVIGSCERSVLRSGAKIGDRVALSGSLGGALGGLRSLERGLGIAALEERFLHPRARRDLAESWGQIANAMIDISDGLSSELNHLARASKVRIEIDAARIPVFAGLAALDEDPLAIALASGDEFELLATSDAALPSGIEIGWVTKGDGVFIDGRPLPSTGWTHWT
jgi:thiamine-monophosphate kinase